MINLHTDCIISLKGEQGTQQITGKDCICESFTIDRLCPPFEDVHSKNGLIMLQKARDPTRLSIELLCMGENFLYDFFDKDFKPKRRISKLNVEDCSIEELLFAVRQKIKNGK